MASFWNPLSKITLSLTLKPFLNHSQPSLVSASLVSASLPRRCCTVAAQPLSLSRLFVTLSSLLLSLAAIAVQPRSPLPRCRRNSAQVLYLWYYQYQRFKLAVNTFSLFFFGFFFFFFGYELSEIFVCGYVICLSRLLFCVWIKPMSFALWIHFNDYGFCLV